MSKVSFYLPPLNEINLKAFTGGGICLGHFTLNAEFLQIYSRVILLPSTVEARHGRAHLAGGGRCEGGSRPTAAAGEAAVAAGTPRGGDGGRGQEQAPGV